MSEAKMKNLLNKTDEVDLDSEEEMNAMLEKAVMQYKRNKRQSTSIASVSPTKHHAHEIIEISKNHCSEISGTNIDNWKSEKLLEHRSDNLADFLDLINYFIVPKKGEEKVLKKKTYNDYEKQGAIPKGMVKARDYPIICHPNKSNKNQANKDKQVISASDSKNCEENHLRAQVRGTPLNTKTKETEIPGSLKSGINLNLDCSSEVEKTYSRPFFYIVPEKPCPNFLLPRGSYYVIPKTPDSSCQEMIIFHPESPTTVTWPQELNPHEEMLSKAQKVDPDSVGKLSKSLNNLGKDAPQRIDSHLNIGPTQVNERWFFDNLETSCNYHKTFEKPVMSPERCLFKVGDISEKVQERCEENSEDFTFEEPEDDQCSSFPESVNMAMETTEEIVREQEPEELGAANLNISRLQEQYERMVRALPESRDVELQEKCYEFQGDEEKVTAYINEVKKKNRLDRLVTDLQKIFPDADAGFLLKEIQQVEGDDDAINILTDKLLEDRNYPKVSAETNTTKKRLWLAYVKNFNVKNYLLNVPEPENFAGKAGDNSKADEELIMEFLMSRYPDTSESFLVYEFNLNQRNLTKTCASLAGHEVVRLVESTFEHANFSEDFLKEVCYIDHKEEIDGYLETLRVMKEIEEESARLDGAFLSCPLCADEELITSEAVSCPEGHVFCKNCIKRYFEVRVGDAVYNFQCPTEGCDAVFTTIMVEELLPEKLSSVVFQKQQAEEISAAKVDGLEFCSQCDFAYIPDPESKIFKCQNPSCLEETCRKCQQKSHIPFRCEEIERPLDLEARKKIEEVMTETLVRRCPRCQKKFVKIDGCNKITCVCGALICYICREIVSGYEHFSDGSRSNGCPLSSRNEDLHVRDVLEAGVRVRDDIVEKNHNIRILHDPTVNHDL